MASPLEARSPARYAVSAGEAVTDIVVDLAARSPGAVVFARPAGRCWRDVTAAEFLGEVDALAAGLVAAGIGPGERIGLVGPTSYEWVLCDFACWSAGAVTVPVYETSSPEQAAWLLRDSGAVAAFAAPGTCLDTVLAASPAGLRQVWSTAPDALARLGAGRGAEAVAELTRRRAALRAADTATIVYTSGTTGRPKGCVLTHRNLLAEAHNVLAADGITERALPPGSSVLLFLPLAHILARVVQLAALLGGARTGHVGDLREVRDQLVAFRPDLVLAVPRVFESLYNTARQVAISGGHRRLFAAAEAAAVSRSRALDAGRGPSWSPRWWLFDRLVYRRLRAAIGGRARYAVSGGAPLDERLGHFLRGAGVTVLEGWGLTETTGGVTLNLPSAQRIGTVGRPLPGCALRLGPDGEVQVRGDVVTSGYWGNPAATEAAFTRDGWFRTGDLGRLDGGYLTITGRQKDLIVTAGGKNVAPAFFEDRLRTHWLIEECLLVGDNRPYVGALLVLDVAAFDTWKRDNGRDPAATVGALRDDAGLLTVLQDAVDGVNAAVSRAERIRRFRVLPAGLDSSEVTPTRKVRRDLVLARLAPEVDALYRA